MAVSIAAPLERRFSTITGVSSIGSTNTAGHSTITVEFDGGRDIDAAIIEVRSAVSEVSLRRDLPAGPVVARGGRR
jgi:HAE1 family hydrophobic/amphiphilic exporter-1